MSVEISLPRLEARLPWRERGCVGPHRCRLEVSGSCTACHRCRGGVVAFAVRARRVGTVAQTKPECHATSGAAREPIWRSATARLFNDRADQVPIIFLPHQGKRYKFAALC